MAKGDARVASLFLDSAPDSRSESLNSELSELRKLVMMELHGPDWSKHQRLCRDPRPAGFPRARQSCARRTRTAERESDRGENDGSEFGSDRDRRSGEGTPPRVALGSAGRVGSERSEAPVGEAAGGGVGPR